LKARGLLLHYRAKGKRIPEGSGIKRKKKGKKSFALAKQTDGNEE